MWTKKLVKKSELVFLSYNQDVCRERFTIGTIFFGGANSSMLIALILLINKGILLHIFNAIFPML